jgi:hypothetical protein
MHRLFNPVKHMRLQRAMQRRAAQIDFLTLPVVAC